MKIHTLVLSIVLVLAVSSPLLAQEAGWTESFLMNFQPPRSFAAAPPAGAQLGTGPVIAQVFQTGTVPISLQEVIGMMLDHNLDIRTNRFNPRSSALATLMSYRTWQPNIRFSGSVSRDTSAVTSVVNAATGNSLSNLRHQFSVGFTQQLVHGTTLSVDGTLNRQSSNSNNATYNPSYTSSVRYTLAQHLLRDRGRYVNTRQTIISQNSEKLTALQFETQVTNLLVQAQKAYWDLVFAAEDLKVKQRSLDIASQTLAENKMKVEIGTLAPIEVKQTESEVANRRQQLIQTTGSMVTNEDSIKKLISSETDPSLFLVRLTTMDTPRSPASVSIPSLAEAVGIAMENRLELRQAAIELENRDIDIDYTRNQKLPVLDATLTFTQNGTGGTRTPRTNLGQEATAIIPGGIWNAFGQLFSYDYRGYSLGFVFTMPLSNKVAKAEHERALNERRISESQLDTTRQQIALEVRNALTQIQQAQASIEQARVARELAQERVDAEQTKFNLGTSTLRFVLEEQRNVAQAETTELQSLVTFTKAVVDLDRAMGLTLMKNNIQIDKAIQAPAIAGRSLVERVRAGN
jgi:outer membrane protein TolC